MKHSTEYTHLPVDEDKVMDKVVDIFPGLIVDLNTREILTLCLAFEEMCHRFETEGY